MVKGMGRVTGAGFHVRVLLLMALFLSGSLTLILSMLSTTTVLTQTSDETCSGVRHVDQVVILLIDALRPDFALPGLSHYYHRGEQCTSTPAANGKGKRDAGRGGSLKYIEENLRDMAHPSHGFFFLADAPTMTGQRIKAITTGTIPAFLETGSNINSDEVKADSLLRQLHKRSILLGDDTWLNLFPDTDNNASPWKRTIGYPSYNLSDFHTNDRHVLENILPILKAETLEQAPSNYAKLVIGHLLGVDHVGHFHRADHSAMDQKLDELDAMLRNVSYFLRHERRTAMRTLMLVFGDHGMLNSGEHGGDSYQETDTMMYAELFDGGAQPTSSPLSLSAAALHRKTGVARARWLKALDGELTRLAPCHDAAGVHPDKLSAVFQVDAPSTIATLLGVPIPFSNLGRIIPELIMLSDADADLNALEKCNWRQVLTCLEESELPIKMEWKEGPMSWQERIAQMSYFGRKKGNATRPVGMFIGSFVAMVAAFALAWNGDVVRILRQKPLGGVWTLLLLLFRLVSVFSMTLLVKENVGVLCLLQVLLVTVLVATPRKPFKRLLFLIILVVCLRLLVPLLYRDRSLITNLVDTVSPLETWIFLHEESHVLYEVVGVLVGALTFTAVSLPGNSTRLATGALTAAMVLCYKRPLLHHVVPLCFFLCTFCVRGGALLRYVAVVLWVSSLCNESIVTSATIAVYGAFLPPIVRATRHVSVFTQVLLLHLLSWVAFFAQGGHCLFTSIDLNSSFVGVPFHSIPLAVLFVLTRMFNAFLFTPMAVMIAHSAERERKWRLCYLLLHVSVAQASFSCLNGYMQRSHVLLFSIFAPKLIFDIVVCLMTCVGYALALVFIC